MVMEKTQQQPLTAIVGAQLSSIEFVQDYVQLRFGGPYLTAITHPTIKTGKGRLTWDDQGYRDQLCKRIGRYVRKASVEEDKAIQLDFDDGASVCISLKPEDYCAAEAAIFDDGHGGWWVW